MSQIAAALKPVLDRLAGFFQVFDLSFFLSGGVCVGAVSLHWRLSGLPIPGMSAGALSFCLALLAYVLGLVCFATGRYVRRALCPNARRGKFGARLVEAMRNNGLETSPEYGPFLRDEVITEATAMDLYTRLWTDFRHRSDVVSSQELLQSYWVRAAVFDGLVVASTAWAVVLGMRGVATHPEWTIWAAVGIAVGCGVASGYEANRLDRQQMTDLVTVLGSVVASRRKLVHATVGEAWPDLLHATMSSHARNLAPNVWASWADSAAVQAVHSDKLVPKDYAAQIREDGVPEEVREAVLLATYRALQCELAASEAIDMDDWVRDSAAASIRARAAVRQVGETVLPGAVTLLSCDPAIEKGRAVLLARLRSTES